jgi:ABC-type glycerol-3-phosphate transport system substrate-binding protein
MRKTVLALALFVAPMLTACATAQAGEVTVYSVGLVGNGFEKLMAAWQKKTGNTIKLPIALAQAPLGVVVNAMNTQPADVVILPVADLGTNAANFRPGTSRNIGRVLFSLGTRAAGGASPRITTEAEFKAAVAGKTILTNDPGTSLNGRMVKAVLDRPEFSTVKQISVPGNSALQFVNQPADFVMSVLPEQIMAAPGVKVVGEIPPSLGLKIDFGGGVLTKAANPELARQFLDYLTTPEAQAIWKSGGVAVPIPAN